MLYFNMTRVVRKYNAPLIYAHCFPDRLFLDLLSTFLSAKHLSSMLSVFFVFLLFRAFFFPAEYFVLFRTLYYLPNTVFSAEHFFSAEHGTYFILCRANNIMSSAPIAFFYAERFFFLYAEPSNAW